MRIDHHQKIWAVRLNPGHLFGPAQYLQLQGATFFGTAAEAEAQRRDRLGKRAAADAAVEALEPQALARAIGERQLRRGVSYRVGDTATYEDDLGF